MEDKLFAIDGVDNLTDGELVRIEGGSAIMLGIFGAFAFAAGLYAAAELWDWLFG